MKKRQTVSLCMIVKNEEETILNCLDSVKQLVNEIIVVDTGSEDRTVELAVTAGARVFSFNWTGDFARARNFALEQAVSDWVLVLDADEVLDPFNKVEFYCLLETPGVEGYFLHLKNYLGAGRDVARDQVVRLFKNKTAYRFAGAIHEQVAASILQANGGRGLAVAPLSISHYGYLEALVLKKDKSRRNTSIIIKELQGDADNPFLWHCLAMEHYQQGEIARGVACLKKALVNMRGSEGYFEDVLINYALGLLHLHKFTKLLSYVSQCLEMLPGHPDLLLLRGVGNLKLKYCKAAVLDLEKTLQNGGSRVFPDFRVLSFLGDAYNLSGNYLLAEKAYLSALNLSGKFLYPLVQILGLLQRGSNNLNIKELSRFACAQKKLELWCNLQKSGDIALASVIILLAMHEMACAGRPSEELVRLTQYFNDTLPRLKPISGRKESMEYLTVACRGIYAYVLMITRGYDSCIYPAGEKLSLLIEKVLPFFIREFCPRWSPEEQLNETGPVHSVGGYDGK